MQTAFSESNQSSRTGPGARRDWVHEDPPEVTHRIAVPGLMAPVGWFKKAPGFWVRIGLTSKTKSGEDVVWDAINLGTVRLSHPVHLMVIEGISPSTLFLGAKLVECDDSSVLWGPYVLLHLNADPLYKVPFCFHDVALGRLTSIPEGAKLTEIIPSMVSGLLTKLET